MGNRGIADTRATWLMRTCALVLEAFLLVLYPGLIHAGPPPILRQVDALILIDAADIIEMDRAVAFIQARGGHVPVTFAPHALFAALPATGSAGWIGQHGIHSILTGRVDVAAIETAFGVQAALASLAWNERLDSAHDPVDRALPPGSDLVNDVLPGDDPAAAGQGTGMAPPASSSTSEFLHGRVQVDVFLPESDGSLDPNTETWTSTQWSQVSAEVAAGVTWWATTATQGGRPSAHLTMNVTMHTPSNEPAIVATEFEPISRPHTDQWRWIGEIMARLGYGGWYQSAVRSYVHDRRVALGRDWGFVFFVVNSAADADGMFDDGYFAYAYRYGPLSVLTYDNDGWGISRMEMVTAHEMAHIFGALDEYASSECTDTATSGYLKVANTNCENGDPPTEDSIMRSGSNQLIAYPNNMASTPIRGMVGWRDSDGDGTYDVADTSVALSATCTAGASVGQPANCSGTAEDIPYPSPTRIDTSINTIDRIEHRLNGGAWISATASDGTLDEYSEGFAVATTPLGAGTHTIQIRARNTAGNHSSILDFTIEVLRAPSSLTATAVSQAHTDLSWTDNSDYEEGFRIERSPDGATRWTEIGTVGANVTTYEDTGLPGGATQTYRVRAYGGTDSSVPSNMASATTPPYTTFFPAIWSARD